MRPSTACFLIVAIATASGSAFGQSDRELATRQELIAKAQALSAAGTHDDALALAKRAGAIKMSASLRMFIAQEELAIGRIADAYGNSRQCATEADADPQLHDRARILAACRTLEESLAGRVGRIVVNVLPPVPPDLHVKVSGEEVSAALLGTPYVVSPGTITVSASATGFTPFTTDVVVKEGGNSVVDVHLAPDLTVPCPASQERVGATCVEACAGRKVRSPADAAQCCWPGQSWSAAGCEGAPHCPTGLVAQGATCVAAAVAVAPTPASPVETKPQPKSLLAPAVLGGAGVALGVAGTIVWFIGDGQYGSLKTRCAAPNGCSTTDYNSTSSSIRTDDALGVTGWVGGGALLASGVLWYLLAPGHSREVAVRVLVDPASRSVALHGSF